MNLHHKIITQNLGNFVPTQSSDTNRAVIKRYAKDYLPDTYLNNWFDADSFFGTEFITGLLKGCYFITLDHFMTSEIYALRKIVDHKIETMSNAEGNNAFSSYDEVKELLNTLEKENK